jgi:hypothetical protein
MATWSSTKIDGSPHVIPIPSAPLRINPERTLVGWGAMDSSSLVLLQLRPTPRNWCQSSD